MSTRCLLAWVLVLTCPLSAAAQDAVEEVRACLGRNIPKKSSDQTVKFVTVDRIGGKREFRGKLLGMRVADGTRRAKLCITRPPEMRGSELLSVETAGRAPETFLYTIELRKPTRISSEGAGANVFGTDFSYEDLERWQQISRPGSHERLPDAAVEGRSAYVLVSRPSVPADSAYAKVVSYVEKQSCVVVKSEAYESGDRLRKVLTVSPGQMLEESGIHSPTEVVIKDVRGETSTTVTIEDLRVDAEIDERSFEVSSLGRHCR